jgi:hypothetical protein
MVKLLFVFIGNKLQKIGSYCDCWALALPPITLWLSASGGKYAKLFSRPPPARQWLRERLTGNGFYKKLKDFDVKRLCQLIQNGNGWILQSAFETANVRPVDLCIDGQVFLRDFAQNPQFS